MYQGTEWFTSIPPRILDFLFETDVQQCEELYSALYIFPIALLYLIVKLDGMYVWYIVYARIPSMQIKAFNMTIINLNLNNMKEDEWIILSSVQHFCNVDGKCPEHGQFVIFSQKKTYKPVSYEPVNVEI